MTQKSGLPFHLLSSEWSFMFVYPCVSSPLLPWCIKCKNGPETAIYDAGYISRNAFRNSSSRYVWQGRASSQELTSVHVFCASTHHLPSIFSQEIRPFFCYSTQSDFFHPLGSCTESALSNKWLSREHLSDHDTSLFPSIVAHQLCGKAATFSHSSPVLPNPSYCSLSASVKFLLNRFQRYSCCGLWSHLNCICHPGCRCRKHPYEETYEQAFSVKSFCIHFPVYTLVLVWVY